MYPLVCLTMLSPTVVCQLMGPVRDVHVRYNGGALDFRLDFRTNCFTAVIRMRHSQSEADSPILLSRRMIFLLAPAART